MIMRSQRTMLLMKKLTIFLAISLVGSYRVWIQRGVGTFQAIIYGKVGQAPVQKVVRNGKNVTVFIVGTGGCLTRELWGQRIYQNLLSGIGLLCIMMFSGFMQYNNL